ncbi:hypothetical protein [Thioclava kandeliae]|uniref:Uncharacterized protein n=1 Tax=Thioclava kandeliae TaxID=3070818 RepID=A0ABV1SFC2_9RHOB
MSSADSVSGPAETTEATPSAAEQRYWRVVVAKAERMKGNHSPEQVKAYLEFHLKLAKAPSCDPDELRRMGAI